MRKRKFGKGPIPIINEINDNVDEDEKKYIYPSIAKSPIIHHNEYIIYGYGSSLILYSMKEKKCVKKIDEHENALRSLDVNINKKYFLTSGDDKIIVIYDEHWSVCYKIIHKKKIVKAYFLKCLKEEDNTFEILFIDKYGDVYLFDLNMVRSGGACLNKEHGDPVKRENNSTTADTIHTIKLKYLIDSLNEIQEKDEDLFFMNNFEKMLHDGQAGTEIEGDTVENLDSTNAEICQVKSVENEEGLREEPILQESLMQKQSKLELMKKKLERHYFENFQNEKLMHPILTCNSAVISLYYDNKFLIIGDRDEKIRIIKNKKMNQIYNFYLKHKLFITSLVLINPTIFCSASADCYLYMWDIKTKEVIDSLYLDFSFLSKLAKGNVSFKSSCHLNKYKFIINTLNFNENNSTIYATAENLKGILIIPLTINNITKQLVKFNKEEVSFFPLHYDVLSFIVLSYNNVDSVIFVDRSKGHLHQIKLTSHGKFHDEVTTLDQHTFFEGRGQRDIGLINYWKHTTIEDDAY
ncbi:hypothetical protein, conserved [Plasmodium gonderi]|uniref:WD domain, G-beta repeat domain containing protein n=1 Tax=Plasmodium gonderi TaxID=77519 RepID=A0A1Y1JPE0_PLAGO|nr:hypothetical protein, conserved [Plasmodium gonderi]GAW83127.1 hypothetical protein, conserved [Plasmodium gonderi]